MTALNNTKYSLREIGKMYEDISEQAGRIIFRKLNDDDYLVHNLDLDPDNTIVIVRHFDELENDENKSSQWIFSIRQSEWNIHDGLGYEFLVQSVISVDDNFKQILNSVEPLKLYTMLDLINSKIAHGNLCAIRIPETNDVSLVHLSRITLPNKGDAWFNWSNIKEKDQKMWNDYLHKMTDRAIFAASIASSFATQILSASVASEPKLDTLNCAVYKLCDAVEMKPEYWSSKTANDEIDAKIKEIFSSLLETIVNKYDLVVYDIAGLSCSYHIFTLIKNMLINIKNKYPKVIYMFYDSSIDTTDKIEKLYLNSLYMELFNSLTDIDTDLTDVEKLAPKVRDYQTIVLKHVAEIEKYATSENMEVE